MSVILIRIYRENCLSSATSSEETREVHVSKCVK